MDEVYEARRRNLGIVVCEIGGVFPKSNHISSRRVCGEHLASGEQCRAWNARRKMQYVHNVGQISALPAKRGIKGRNIDAVIARGDRMPGKSVGGRVQRACDSRRILSGGGRCYAAIRQTLT